MATLTAQVQTQSKSKFGKAILAGLTGGIVFGMMMQMMGTMSMIAKMAGSNSDAVGWLLHLMISAVFGLTYLFLAPKFSNSGGRAALGGMIYGVIIWVAGPLIMMPIMMGMPGMIFQIGSMQWMSLMGHIIYGVIVALVYYRLAR